MPQEARSWIQLEENTPCKKRKSKESEKQIFANSPRKPKVKVFQGENISGSKNAKSIEFSKSLEVWWAVYK